MDRLKAGRYVSKLDTDALLPPCVTGHNQIRVTVEPSPSFLPTLGISATTTIAPTVAKDQVKIFHCKYCSFTTEQSCLVMQHEHRKHGDNDSVDNYQDDAMDTSNSLSVLPRDEIQELGEELPNSHDEILIIGKANDDDEDEAYVSSFPPSTFASSSSSSSIRLFSFSLRGCQPETNNPTQPISTNNNQPFIKHSKRFPYPHCEHVKGRAMYQRSSTSHLYIRAHQHWPNRNFTSTRITMWNPPRVQSVIVERIFVGIPGTPSLARTRANIDSVQLHAREHHTKQRF